MVKERLTQAVCGVAIVTIIFALIVYVAIASLLTFRSPVKIINQVLRDLFD